MNPALPRPDEGGADLLPASPLAGILWMVATGLCFVAVNALVKLAGPGIPAAQAAFLRFGFGVLILTPVLLAVLRAGLPAGTGRLLALRGAVHAAAVCLWFHAMARLPVSEAVAIGYLTPVVVVLGAALVFGERLGPRHLAALAGAALGALLILRPGLREIAPAHLAQIGAALCFAASYLCARVLGARMGPGAVVAMLSLTVTLGLAPLAAWVWVPLGLREVALMAGVAAFATAAHYAMMRAFAAAPLTVTQPVVFLQVLWAAGLDLLVFHKPVDPLVLAGAAVIIAAVSALAWREAMVREAG